MSSESKMTAEQHDVLLNATEGAIAANHESVRAWSDRSKVADKELEAAILAWNAEFPVRSAIAVHRENCERDAQRKLDLIAQGLPPDYVVTASKPQSAIDAAMLHARGGNVNSGRYGAHRRGAYPGQKQGQMVERPKLPSRR
jgi:hypothetical protein